MEGFILDMLSLRRLTLLGFSLLELFHYRPPQPVTQAQVPGGMRGL